MTEARSNAGNLEELADAYSDIESMAARREAMVKYFLEDWREFYSKYFNIELGDVKIPDKSPSCSDFTQLLVVAKGLTNVQVYDACTKHFVCFCHGYDLNADITPNERDSTHNYAVWVRNVIDADEVLRNKSAKMMRDEKLLTETLLERILHELKYFSETGKHLDLINVTLCSGSRYRWGFVPTVDWSRNKLEIAWRGLEFHKDNLRPRQVIY